MFTLHFLLRRWYPRVVQGHGGKGTLSYLTLKDRHFSVQRCDLRRLTFDSCACFVGVLEYEALEFVQLVPDMDILLTFRRVDLLVREVRWLCLSHSRLQSWTPINVPGSSRMPLSCLTSSLC